MTSETRQTKGHFQCACPEKSPVWPNPFLHLHFDKRSILLNHNQAHTTFAYRDHLLQTCTQANLKITSWQYPRDLFPSTLTCPGGIKTKRIVAWRIAVLIDEAATFKLSLQKCICFWKSGPMKDILTRIKHLSGKNLAWKLFSHSTCFFLLFFDQQKKSIVCVCCRQSYSLSAFSNSSCCEFSNDDLLHNMFFETKSLSDHINE